MNQKPVKCSKCVKRVSVCEDVDWQTFEIGTSSSQLKTEINWKKVCYIVKKADVKILLSHVHWFSGRLWLSRAERVFHLIQVESKTLNPDFPQWLGQRHAIGVWLCVCVNGWGGSKLSRKCVWRTVLYYISHSTCDCVTCPKMSFLHFFSPHFQNRVPVGLYWYCLFLLM